uniref:Uncharacterized protein n=1 Tax=Ficedula albicollis TaxID=59894 RepID=A0A803VX95_FICAL
MRKERFRLDVRGQKKNGSGCKALKLAAQGSGGVPIPEGVQRVTRVMWHSRPGRAALAEPLSGVSQFTGSAFGSAAIWQYESLKSRVQTYFEEARADWMDKMRPQKRGDFRKQVNSWWNNLTEGQRTVTGLC